MPDGWDPKYHDRNELREVVAGARRMALPGLAHLEKLRADEEGSLWEIGEAVLGGSVGELMVRSPGGRLAPSIAVAIVRDAARTLDAAARFPDSFGRPRTHGFLLPRRVRVDFRGNVKLTGFFTSRMARMATDTGLAAEDAELVPFQSRKAMVGGLGTEEDVFSLGAILYAATTGQVPLRTSDPHGGLWRAGVEIRPGAPTELDQDYPPALQAVVLKAMSESRYRSGAELAAACESFLDGAGLTAGPEEVGERVRSLLGDRR